MKSLISKMAVAIAGCFATALVAGGTEAAGSAADAGSVVSTASLSGHAAVSPAPFPAPRIIGGVRANAGEWPGVAALVSVSPSAFPLASRQFCGATLLAPRWALTAAHCVVSPEEDSGPMSPGLLRLVANAHDLTADNLVESVVSNIFVHPEYAGGEAFYANDIALLELGEALLPPFAALFKGRRKARIGDHVHAVGWGVISHDGNDTSLYDTILNAVSLPLIDNATCNLSASYGGYVSDTQFCAGYAEGGMDSCQGDSGGPAYIREGSEWQQIGIVSFGAGCAQKDKYGIYTDIAAYHDWLRDYILGRVPEEQELHSVAAADMSRSHLSDGGGISWPFLLLILPAFLRFHCCEPTHKPRGYPCRNSHSGKMCWR